jgi:AraC-like DNA-binding protein
MEVLKILSFCSFMLGMLAVSILVFINRINTFSRYMLALSFFSLSWLMLTNYLLLSHYIYVFPHLFRTSSPLTYLIIPCGYLYVRSILYKEKRFKKYDWVHFTPAFLHILELMPFYVKSTAFKQGELKIILTHLNDVMYTELGLLPTHTHMLLKVSLGLLYIIYQFHIIHRFIKAHHSKPGRKQWYTYNWLWLLTIAYAALTGLIFIVGALHIPVLEENAYLLVSSCICVVFMVTMFLLFFKPHILYGHVLHMQASEATVSATETSISQEQTSKKIILNPTQRKEYRDQIEYYFDTQKPYLRQGFTARDMENETGIPRHHLSSVINTEYGVHFNDWVNERRIDYVKNHLDLRQLEHLTIEAIAEKAGFNSRTTFFHAVKKLTGMAPSTFIKTLKQQNPEI